MSKKHLTLIKNRRLNDFISVYDLRLLALLTLIYLAISIMNLGLFPDFLGLSNHKEPSKILELLCTILTSTVAVVVAFVVITFEVLKRKLGPHALKGFFSNKNFARWITLSVAAIFLSVITLIRYDGISNNTSLTLYYYDTILALLALVTLFPICYDVLEMSTSTAPIEEAVEAFKKTLGQGDHNLQNVTMNTWDSLVEYQGNPVNRLRDIAIRYVRDGDTAEAQAIMRETTLVVLSHLGNTPTGDRIYQAFNKLLLVWKSIMSEAIGKKDTRTLEALWRNVRWIYRHIALNKLYLGDFHELESFVGEYISSLDDEGYEDPMLVGFEVLNESMREQFLLNCPPAEEISLTYYSKNELPPKKLDFKFEYHWKLMTSDYVAKLQEWGEAAARKNNSAQLDAVSVNLHTLLFDVRESSVNNLLKRSFANNILMAMAELAKRRIDMEVQRFPSLSLPLSPSDIEEILEKEEDYYAFAVIVYCSTISYIIRSKYPVDYWTLNELGTLGRILSTKESRRREFKESQLYVVEYFLRVGMDLVKVGKNSSQTIKWLTAQFEDAHSFYSSKNSNPDPEIIEKFALIRIKIAELPYIQDLLKSLGLCGRT